MNSNTHNGDHRQPPSASPGHPSLPPQYQHHLQQLHSQHPPATQDPQLAFLLANATAAAAARGQPTPGAVPGHLGVGNNNIGAGIVHPGRFGSNNEHHGNPGAMPNAQSAAAQLFEEQILQRASALRAEALMQQRQQSQQAAHSQQHQMNPQNLQIQAALQAFQQQQQLSSLNGAAPTPSSNGNTSPTITTDLIQQQQEKVLMARAQALRDLGLGGSAFEKLDMNRLIQHRQHTQQQQQRAQFGLEHEIERVRQAQRLAAMGSPKPSVPGGPPVPPDGASAVLSSVSAAAAASEAVQKAIPSSNEGPERGIPSAPKPVIPPPPKPPAEVVKTEPGAASGAASKPSSELSSSAGPTASGKTTPQPKATAGGMAGSPEQTKATKETAGAGAAAAAAVRCKTKEELRKNPGTVIVPCRARGMPMDHNFISAYFVISEDAKHGENLVCSYYACRNGGIKFRYCAYCMAPVAKRNFSRRHDHGMSKNKGAAKIKDEEEDEEDDDTTLGGSENTGSDKGSTSIATMPSQLTLKRPKEGPSSEDGSKRQRLEPAPTISTEANVRDIAGDVSSKRRSMWNDLLAKRPRAKDPNTLSSWLNEVLAVSDLEFPLEQVGTNLDHPFGKLLMNELPKLAKPAATPTEDEAGDTMDTSNDSPDNSDSASKDNSITAANTNTADTVVGNEKSPAASSKDEKETASAGETAKDETAEAKKSTEEDSSSKEQETKDPDTPVRDNTKTESTSDNNGSSRKVLNLLSKKSVLGKKSKLSPKKSIIADVEEESQKEKKKEDEGFAGSFADWRDRKKGKSLKKGSGSLRK